MTTIERSIDKDDDNSVVDLVLKLKENMSYGDFMFIEIVSFN